jgi:hypothetical protein
MLLAQGHTIALPLIEICVAWGAFWILSPGSRICLGLIQPLQVEFLLATNVAKEAVPQETLCMRHDAPAKVPWSSAIERSLFGQLELRFEQKE